MAAIFGVQILISQEPSRVLLSEQEKPSFEHCLTSKDILLDTLEIEDHSKWVIAPTDVYRFVSWEVNDKVVLTPHSSLFSFYKFQYYLNNLTRQSYVRVNLVSHPCDYQKPSRWVISIDKFSNRLFLSDGSSWKVDPVDASSFQKWDINDFIIYGKNVEVVNKYSFLLINARLNAYVRAIEF